MYRAISLLPNKLNRRRIEISHYQILANASAYIKHDDYLLIECVQHFMYQY